MLRHIPSCSSSIAILNNLFNLSRCNRHGADLITDKTGRDVGEYRRVLKACTTGQSQSAHRYHGVAGSGHVKNISWLRGKVLRCETPAKQAHRSEERRVGKE